ncbi:MAG TPA: hypothetical protein VNR42_10490, partial [Solirubrobacteraceae bacterium]|nr:hypothetical protein [Solirubrobacteraceae bacterium]
MSDAAVSYAFENLEPSPPPPRDAAERALAQAHTEAEQIREQARAEGHAAGHAEGLADVSAALAALGEARQGVESLRTETVESVERDAVQLA